MSAEMIKVDDTDYTAAESIAQFVLQRDWANVNRMLNEALDAEWDFEPAFKVATTFVTTCVEDGLSFYDVQIWLNEKSQRILHALSEYSAKKAAAEIAAALLEKLISGENSAESAQALGKLLGGLPPNLSEDHVRSAEKCGTCPSYDICPIRVERVEVEDHDLTGYLN